MAKVQKEILSQDELLNRALVDKSDQPYEVPRNWVWTRLGNIAQIIGGGTPPSNITKYYENGNIAWITPADLSGYNNIFITKGRKSITELGIQKSSAKLLPENSVLLSTRAPIGYVAIASQELSTNQGFKSFLPSVAYFPKYLFFYFKSIKNVLESYASGTTFLELSASKVALVEIPLPPLSEQGRIVKNIESLFEKLDSAKELVQNALESFESRRDAILYKAITGQLTKNWREQNEVSLEHWEQKKLKDTCSVITDGTHQTPSYEDSGYIFLSSRNVTSGKINWENVKYISEHLHEQLYGRIKPQINDILLAKNGTTGIAAIVDRECVFDIYVSLAILRPITTIIKPQYLLYAINNPITKAKLKGELKGIGVQNLHLKNIRETTIPIPTLPEQKEIVYIVNSLLEKEETAKDLYDIIEKIDLMKKTILARAFRGELGTNNPQEESSIELLKKVLAERINLEQNPIERKIKVYKDEEVFEMPKDILELLQLNKIMTPEQLKKSSELEVDDFYEALKKYIDDNKIHEVRKGQDVFLEAGDENR